MADDDAFKPPDSTSSDSILLDNDDYGDGEVDGRSLIGRLTEQLKAGRLMIKSVFDFQSSIANEDTARQRLTRSYSSRTIQTNSRYIECRKKRGIAWRTFLSTNGKLKADSALNFSFDAVDVMNEIPLVHKTIEQIHKDVPRTFPGLQFFEQNEMQLSLRKVLVAISNYIPALSYVQGMNLIAGFLFLHFDTENGVFTFMVQMLTDRRLRLSDVFCEGLPLLVSFTNLLEMMIQSGDKVLFDHLRRIGISKFVFLYQWILSLFTYSMPFAVVEKIWDRFFTVGWHVMFKAFLVLIISNREELLRSDFESAFLLLRNAPAKVEGKRFISQIDGLLLKPEHERLIDDIVLNNVSFPKK